MYVLGVLPITSPPSILFTFVYITEQSWHEARKMSTMRRTIERVKVANRSKPNCRDGKKLGEKGTGREKKAASKKVSRVPLGTQRFCLGVLGR